MNSKKYFLSAYSLPTLEIICDNYYQRTRIHFVLFQCAGRKIRSKLDVLVSKIQSSNHWNYLQQGAIGFNQYTSESRSTTCYYITFSVTDQK